MEWCVENRCVKCIKLDDARDSDDYYHHHHDSDDHGMDDDDNDDECVYEGGLDSDGRKHGRGSLYDAQMRLVFCGRFVNDKKFGRGTMFFPDDGASLTGQWNGDALCGYGVYTSGDGSTVCGHYEDGMLEGLVIERFANGAIRFKGEYKHSTRHGRGVCVLDDGGMYEGTWVDGKLEGDDIVYYFQRNFRDVRLVGRWLGGDMVEGKYNGQTFACERSCQHRLCTDERLIQADPYECATVVVKPSTICGAGEGLFARRDIPNDTICAYYNGIHVSQKEVDNRDWKDCDNTITMQSEECLDVPSRYSSCSVYNASLGHKANHSFNANAKYWPCEHVRFGHIMSVRSIRHISCGEEITVNYDYTEDDRPWWYNME